MRYSHECWKSILQNLKQYLRQNKHCIWNIIPAKSCSGHSHNIWLDSNKILSRIHIKFWTEIQQIPGQHYKINVEQESKQILYIISTESYFLYNFRQVFVKFWAAFSRNPGHDPIRFLGRTFRDKDRLSRKILSSIPIKLWAWFFLI